MCVNNKIKCEVISGNKLEIKSQLYDDLKLSGG